LTITASRNNPIIPAITLTPARPRPLASPSPHQIPTKPQADSVSAELRRRAALPDYVRAVIEALPPGTHPMTQFATAILALQVRPLVITPPPPPLYPSRAASRCFSAPVARPIASTDFCNPPPPQPESVFAKAYEAGLPKSKYWDPVFEDSLNLIAKLPAIAAAIYRRTFHKGDYIESDPTLDWAANLAHMMGGWWWAGGWWVAREGRPGPSALLAAQHPTYTLQHPPSPPPFPAPLTPPTPTPAPRQALTTRAAAR
jgi:hypothetical protein